MAYKITYRPTFTLCDTTIYFCAPRPVCVCVRLGRDRALCSQEDSVLGSHYDLGFLIFPSSTPECWEFRSIPTCPTKIFIYRLLNVNLHDTPTLIFSAKALTLQFVLFWSYLGVDCKERVIARQSVYTLPNLTNHCALWKTL